MTKAITILSITALLSICGSADLWAQPFSGYMSADGYDATPDAIPTPRDNNDNLGGSPDPADINDAINLLLGTSYTRNSDVDFLRHTGPDAIWTDLSSLENDGTYVFISLTAANKNTLRVYDVTTPGVKLGILGPLSGFGYTGDGTIGDPFLGAFSPLASGTNFGWNLKSDPAVGADLFWDSNPAFNTDKLDHMLTYKVFGLTGKSVYIDTGSGASLYTFKQPFLLAFEDKPFNPSTGRIGDEDYDDSIFLVDRVAPVPEPMTMALLGSGLVGLARLRQRQRI